MLHFSTTMILRNPMRRRFSRGVDLCELQQRRNFNDLGFRSFHGTFAAINGAILSATNSMAGGKLQQCDEKRFEQPQLASSQAIGAIVFPFEAIGKRFFIVAKLQLRGLGGKIAVDRISSADRTKFQ